MRPIAIGLPLFAIYLVACGGRTAPEPGGAGADDAAAGSGATGFPVGTYTNCADGLLAADASRFLSISGIVPDATLTVTQSGSSLTATYQNGETNRFDFAADTTLSATLAPAGQPGSARPAALCVRGPGSTGVYPTGITATAGALTYDSGAVFVSLEATLRADAGPCGRGSSPASLWIICDDGPTPRRVDREAPPSTAELPVDDYTCHSQVATNYRIDGRDHYVTSGGNGTLTLTQIGAEATARYSGDPSIAGTLRLNVTTDTAANPEPDQSLTAPCDVPIELRTPEALQVAAGSLTVNDSTLFLSFAGTMGASSSCPGAQKAGTLVCSRM